jgi:hypothetical protein
MILERFQRKTAHFSGSWNLFTLDGAGFAWTGKQMELAVGGAD